MDNYGQLGNGGATTTSQNRPVKATIDLAVDVDGGNEFYCATRANGSVWCWGNNSKRQLGDPAFVSTYRDVPMPVPALTSNVVQIGAGRDFACALKADGAVWCWGANSYGQCGVPMATSVPPSQVAGLGTGVVELTVGYGFACVRKSDRTVWCWGYDTEGQLGDDSTTSTQVPRQVKTGTSTFLTNVIQVAAGDFQTCAVTTAGAVYCWGQGALGAMGNGTLNAINKLAAPTSALPVPAAHLSLGYHSACATLRDGRVYCWGTNTVGQVGDKTTVNRSVPTRNIMFVNPANGLCDYGESTVSDTICRKPEACGDGLDNDGDGAADCADSDCTGEAACVP